MLAFSVLERREELLYGDCASGEDGDSELPSRDTTAGRHAPNEVRVRGGGELHTVGGRGSRGGGGEPLGAVRVLRTDGGVHGTLH